MSQPRYTVTYGNSRGLAEPMRWILSYGGAQWEDRRVNDEEWAKIKPATPFGVRPLLEVDGRMMCQSGACARYLARTFGLLGSDDWQTAQIDMIADCMQDTVMPMMALFYEQDQTRKEAMKRKYEQEQLPVFLKNLEKFLEDGKGQYFVGDKLSYADIKVAQQLSFLDMGFEHNKELYPKLFALKARVENEPKIKAWIEKRPDSHH